ncbi:MBL fold metallo-hydrolase [Eubacteriales bacterium OttesenSCG-928-K08]|nr:MBL fold metallo-hydrolase [Eubacteriales bacterium OttesenSCG-928-K08]
MIIRYLGNSGFALERDNELLVIDCYNPASHTMLQPENLKKMSSVTVLVSHRHGDHFSKHVFDMPKARFAVGFDVPAPKEAVLMNPGDTVELNGITIRAFGSTDEGVSFHIQWGGNSIFHAGDLNDWHWRNEGNQSYSEQAEARFLEELERIKAQVKHLDIAFFPVDPRMEEDYYRGAVLFARAMRPKRFIPMHFGASFNPPDMFFEEMKNYTAVDTSVIS